MTAVVTLIVGAISAGVSYYNQKSAAASQSRIASANFMLQSQAAEMERQSAQFQFEQNQKQFDLEKKQQLQQAEMLRSQADSEETASRANVAATRKDYERMKAIQRARLAKSGVVEAGTPLDILAETAGQMELAIANQQFESSLEQQKTRFQANVTEAGAYNTEFQGAIQGFRDSAAIAGARNRSAAAQIEQMVGMNSAKQMRREATAGLISSGLGIYSQYSNMRYSGAIR
jgi:hypothetical protein